MSDFDFNNRAILDFQEARRKADLREVFARLTGKSTELLSYEDVRQKLRAIEGSGRELKEIPLDAIVGSVGRYTDFTRDFLPRSDSNQARWTGVMSEAVGLRGLPPIDVYQIGETYFVLDGNHRVSVARQLGAKQIQANVIEVRTRVPLTPDVQPDDLILKAEYAIFLEQTKIDKLRPEADLSVTLPGKYPILEEHISVHRYLMGIDEGRPIAYAEAVEHWYDQVYLPVIEIIQEKGLLRHFPHRTEADLYLWLSQHRAELEESLGWQVQTELAIDDLASRFSPDFLQVFARITNRILDAVTLEGLDAGPPTGTWRKTQTAPPNSQRLFGHILVALSKDDHDWQALEQAIHIGTWENAQLQGLHVVPDESQLDNPQIQELQAEFLRRCQAAGLMANFAVEVGEAAQRICERAHWTDLIIGKLTHPPEDRVLARLSSGFRLMVRRCSRPILAVPNLSSAVDHLLLAYNGSPKADEALFISAYFACHLQKPLTVLTVESKEISAEQIQEQARAYLNCPQIKAEFLIGQGTVAQAVLETAEERQCDLILIGGYKASPLVEVVKGSIVDQILRETHIPTLICR